MALHLPSEAVGGFEVLGCVSADVAGDLTTRGSGADAGQVRLGVRQAGFAVGGGGQAGLGRALSPQVGGVFGGLAGKSGASCGNEAAAAGAQVPRMDTQQSPQERDVLGQRYSVFGVSDGVDDGVVDGGGFCDDGRHGVHIRSQHLSVSRKGSERNGRIRRPGDYVEQDDDEGDLCHLPLVLHPVETFERVAAAAAVAVGAAVDLPHRMVGGANCSEDEVVAVNDDEERQEKDEDKEQHGVGAHGRGEGHVIPGARGHQTLGDIRTPSEERWQTPAQ